MLNIAEGADDESVEDHDEGDREHGIAIFDRMCASIISKMIITFTDLSVKGTFDIHTTTEQIYINNNIMKMTKWKQMNLESFYWVKKKEEIETKWEKWLRMPFLIIYLKK